MPDGQEHLHQVGAGDLIDRSGPDGAIGVALQRRPPVLLGAAGSLPAWTVHCDDLLDRLREGGDRVDPPQRPGVLAGSGQLAVLEGDVAGLCQRGVLHASQPDVLAVASDGAPPDPLLGPSGCHPQHQAVQVVVPARFVDRSDEGNRQTAHRSAPGECGGCSRLRRRCRPTRIWHTCRPAEWPAAFGSVRIVPQERPVPQEIRGPCPRLVPRSRDDAPGG